MIYNLQLLRAVAALIVIFVHFDTIAARTHLPLPIGFGGGGVDLFFVVSGFVMIHTTDRRHVTPHGFFINRLVRVAPLYWLLTILLFVSATIVPGLFNRPPETIANLLKSLSFIPYYSDGAYCPIIFVGWTLNIEMAFYVIFALALFNPSRAARIGMVCAVLAVAAAIGVTKPTGVAGFYANPMVVEFAMGMLLAASPRWTVGIRPAVAAVVVILGAFLLVFGEAYFPDIRADIRRPLILGSGAWLIVWGAIALERAGITARQRFVQLLGGASYAMYLTHVIPIRLVGKMLGPMGPVGGIGVVAVTVALVIAVALVTHICVERPLSRLLRRDVGQPRPVTEVAEDAALAGALRKVAADR